MKLYLLLLASLASAADTAPEARSMFFDPTSGVKVVGRDASPGKSSPIAPMANRPGAPPIATLAERVTSNPRVPVREVSMASTVPRNTGLRYWIELLKPNGELQRVTASQAFRSGEEIRLHIETNVDGRLTIYQKSLGGKLDRLFPDSRVNAGDNVVRANRDTLIPSSSARFVFDAKAGTENLTLLFEPLPGESTPALASSGGLSAAGEDSEYRTLQARVQAASRSLFLAVDTKSKDAASYAINTNWNTHRQTSGEVAIEIQLIHQ